MANERSGDTAEADDRSCRLMAKDAAEIAVACAVGVVCLAAGMAIVAAKALRSAAAVLSTRRWERAR